jgi:hypothetical protein
MQHSNLWAKGISGQDFWGSRAKVLASTAWTVRECAKAIDVAVAT